MMRADALTLFCAHALDCDSRMPVSGVTVIVRINATDIAA